MSKKKPADNEVVLIRPSYGALRATVVCGFVCAIMFAILISTVKQSSLFNIMAIGVDFVFGLLALGFLIIASESFSQVREWKRLGLEENQFPRDFHEVCGMAKIALEAFEQQKALAAGLYLVQEAAQYELKDSKDDLGKFGLTHPIEDLQQLTKFREEKDELKRKIASLENALIFMRPPISEVKTALAAGDRLLFAEWKLDKLFPSAMDTNVNTYKSQGINECYYRLDQVRQKVLEGQVLFAGGSVMKRLGINMSMSVDEQKRLGFAV